MRYLFIAIFLFFLCELSQAQWKQVFVGYGEPATCIYFLEGSSAPQIGFAGVGSDLWRTPDGGNTWNKVWAGKFTTISQIVFKDAYIGWAGLRGNASPGGMILKTIDGGISWSEIPNTQFMYHCECLYYNPFLRSILAGSWGTGIWFSSDDGLTWKQTCTEPGISGFAFSDDNLYGLATSASRPNFPYLMTNDGGFNWQKIDFGKECWQAIFLGLGKNGEKRFIGGFEGSGIKRTDDGGQTWRRPPIALWPPTTVLTGDIHGSECRIYCQTAGDNTRIGGIWRTDDTCYTWLKLGGPQFTYSDVRFWQKDKHIIAGDSLGNIFYLYDTIQSFFTNYFKFDSDIVSFKVNNNCDEGRHILHFRNPLVCDTIHIYSIKLEILTGYPFMLEQPSDSPRTIQPGFTDSITIIFPKDAPGNSSSRLRLTIGSGEYRRDTVIFIQGSRPVPKDIILSGISLQFDSVSICDTTGSKDLLSIQNPSACDTLVLDSLWFTDDVSFSSDSAIATIITAGSTIQLPITFRSDIERLHNGRLHIRYRTPREVRDTVIYLQGSSYHRIPRTIELSRVALQFDSLSFCDTSGKTIPIAIQNPVDCDSIAIDSIWIDGDQAFSVSTGLRALGPKMAAAIPLIFHSTTVGPHSADLHIRFRTPSGSEDTVVVLQGSVFSDNGIALTDVVAIDFGSTTKCQERDSAIAIKNIGCGDLHIVKVSIAGSGFICHDTSLVIAPGSTVYIPIFTLIDSSNGQSSNNAQVTIQTGSSMALPPILLSRSFYGPLLYPLSLEVNPTVVQNQDTVQIVVSARSLPQNVRSLRLRLAVTNTDLLQYVGYQSRNVVSLSKDTIFISGQPTLSVTNETLAILKFIAYFTKDSIAQITCSDPVFNFDEPYYSSCVAQPLGSTQTSVIFQYSCGEPTLKQYLWRMYGISRMRVKPNPANEVLNIQFEANSEILVPYSLADVSGKLVESGQWRSRPGSNMLSIDVAYKEAGFYILSFGKTPVPVLIVH